MACLEDVGLLEEAFLPSVSSQCAEVERPSKAGGGRREMDVSQFACVHDVSKGEMSCSSSAAVGRGI